FLPWPGFFFKAMRADCMVLLDSVQFPRGRSWMTRNRLKSAHGELWLSVPVHRKGRGLQTIGEVKLFRQKNWQRKHLTSIRQWYANAPYLEEYLPTIEKIYAADDARLVSLNLRFIRLLWETFRIDTQLILQSETGMVGQRTDLIIRISRRSTRSSGGTSFPICPLSTLSSTVVPPVPGSWLAVESGWSSDSCPVSYHRFTLFAAFSKVGIAGRVAGRIYDSAEPFCRSLLSRSERDRRREPYALG
ncbi:MAG: WbqC family protein, partial [Acidobacteriota bacterium]